MILLSKEYYSIDLLVVHNKIGEVTRQVGVYAGLEVLAVVGLSTANIVVNLQ